MPYVYNERTGEFEDVPEMSRPRPSPRPSPQPRRTSTRPYYTHTTPPPPRSGANSRESGGFFRGLVKVLAYIAVYAAVSILAALCGS